MDDLERRIAAIELVMMEVLPSLDAAVVRDAIDVISDGLSADADADGQLVRRLALQLIRDGRWPPAGRRVKRHAIDNLPDR